MNQKIIKLWLIFGIIIGFVSVILFSLTYLNNNVLCDLQCREKNEVELVLIMLSLIGLFVGSLSYYFISEKYLKQIDLSFEIPRGKVSGLMGILNLLQMNFQKVNIKILAEDGKMTEDDYENKIKEALMQLGINLK